MQIPSGERSWRARLRRFLEWMEGQKSDRRREHGGRKIRPRELPRRRRQENRQE